MHFLKDQGIVIRRRNVGEADKIITLFSRQNGKTQVVAKGVRKITSRRGGLLEPFNQLSFQAVKSHNRYVLTEVELLKPFYNAQSNLEDYGKLFTACELIDTLCGEDEALPSLYDRVLTFASDIEKSMLQFQTDVLVQLGYWNPQRQFMNENESSRYIESIIERKLRSRNFSS